VRSMRRCQVGRAPVIEHAYNQVRSFNQLKGNAHPLHRMASHGKKPPSESLMTGSGHLPPGQSRLARVLLVYMRGKRTTVLEEPGGHFGISARW